MRSRASPPRLVHLESGREHHVKGHLVWLLTLKECYSRETADDLKNYRCARNGAVCAEYPPECGSTLSRPLLISFPRRSHMVLTTGYKVH